MLSIEEVKKNLITSDIKLVSYSSTTAMMHGAIYIRSTIHSPDKTMPSQLFNKIQKNMVLQDNFPYMRHVQLKPIQGATAAV